MTNRFEQLPNSGDSENLNNDGASLHEGVPFVPKPEQLGKIVEEGPGSIKFGEKPPIGAGEKDRRELEEFMRKTQSEILLNIMAGGKERLGVDDISRHDTEFAPKKMAEIEKDAQNWVENMPANLDKLSRDPNGYNTYVEFLQSRGRQKEIMPEKDFSVMIDKLRSALEKKDPGAERLLKDHYEGQRLRSMIGVPTELEKHEPAENPYKEIEKRLGSAQEELKKQGFNEDAENLGRTIERVSREIASGKEPSEILLWSSQVEEKPHEEPAGIDKILETIGKWERKIPIIGKYMSRDWREPVRAEGGTIIRKDGTQEPLYTYTRFKKKGAKPFDENAGRFPGYDGYDYAEELEDGDEIISWKPSKQTEAIIMEKLSAGKKPPSATGFSSSIGESGIDYWTSQFHTGNVEFRNKENRDPETRQIYSYARLEIFPPPYKKT